MKVAKRLSHGLRLLFVAFVFGACGVSVASEEPLFNEQSVHLLEERISYWYQRDRLDRLEGVIEQMLRVNPQHPLLLEVQSILALQQQDKKRATRIFSQLQHNAPDHPATLRLRETIALSSTEQQALSDARLLYLAGRYAEASKAVLAVFPTAPYSPDLAIEYWQIRARAGEAKAALLGLQDLHTRYPNHNRTALAIISTRLLQDTLSEADFHQLDLLATDVIVGEEALSLWERAAWTLQPVKAHLQLFEPLLQQHPGQEGIREIYLRLQAQYQAQQQLAADRYYQRQQRGLRLLEEGDPKAAEAWLRDALPARRDDPQLLGGLGYAALRQGRHGEAVSWFRLAVQKEPENKLWTQMEKVATFWRDLQLVDVALDEQRYRAAWFSLHRLMHSPQAEGNLPGLRLREARIAQGEGNTGQAQRIYLQILRDNPDSSEAAWALFTSYRDAEAYDRLDAFYTQLSPELQMQLHDEYQRLQANRLVAQADTAQAEGKHEQAYELLEKALVLSVDNPWLVARLSQLDEEQGRTQQAATRFEQLMAQVQSPDSYFTYALYLARNGRDESAMAAIKRVPVEERSEGMLELMNRLDSRIRLARFSGNWRQALARDEAFFNSADTATLTSILTVMADDASPGDSGYLQQINKRLALLSANDADAAASYAEASRFAQAVEATQLAFDWSMRAIALQRREDGGRSQLWRSASTDDWRVPGLQNRALSFVKQHEKVLYLGFERNAKSGTPGISELQADSLMIDLRIPFSSRAGYWHLRVDPTWLNAGALDLDDSFWRNRLGTGLLCETDCPQGIQQPTEEFGVALGVGADLDSWWFDIGRSPVGFNSSEWVGGLGIRASLADFGIRLAAERRILSSTLISFAGMQDPFSDRNWGAVTRNGIGLGMSWDQGGQFGWWGNLGAEYYEGTNVAANHRWYAYSGGYWRAYDSEPLAITVGLTGLSWGFDKDLSQPTLGQGQYYSPGSYRSLSLPITLFGRFKRFSYLLRGSIGYSDTKVVAEDFFPAHPDLQQQAADRIDTTFIEPVFAGGSGGGKSHSFSAVFEYHLDRHWYIGLRTNLVRSDTFAPNQGMIYLRYHFGGFDLPVQRPPDPPSRYVDR